MARGYQAARAVTITTCCWVIAACAGTGSDGTAVSAGAISATTNRTVLTIQQGTSDTLTVTVGRPGGYTGGLTLSPQVTGAAVIAATVDSVVTLGNVTALRVTVAVAASSPVGVQLVTLIVQPTGTVAAARVELTIAVTAPTAIALSMSQSLGGYPGTSAKFPMMVRRINYSGAIALALANVPAGITASFRPNVLLGTDTNAVMTLTFDSTLAVGTYQFDVRVDGSVAALHAAQPVSLKIWPLASVALTLSGDLSGPSGGTAVATVTIARTNFDGMVYFTVSGLPPGVTVSTRSEPAVGDADAAVLTFAVVASQPAGRFPIVIYGTAPGAVPYEVGIPATLTITP